MMEGDLDRLVACWSPAWTGSGQLATTVSVTFSKNQPEHVALASSIFLLYGR
jgi:hypothetical protein